MNDLLRRALADARLTEAGAAARLGVDPKTVHRWVAGRVPYPRHRTRIATLVGRDEAELWPQLAVADVQAEPPTIDVLATYSHRWAVPRLVWQQLFQSARKEIGILAYAGLFLAEDMGIMRMLAERARNGVSVRILLGDPNGTCVAERGSDEGVGESMAAKIRNALVHYRALRDVDGAEIRLHDTVLYNSIYRADDGLLINPHAYGIAASQAPVLQLRRAEDGDMASTYLESFERVWSGAFPMGLGRVP
ncbi:XRE family transcriptional regulator [Actinomadura geliboluensis]|uniref:XRE family transcriptional regulator n=1 Tax=Actinomadura geliboluensis TaxID=882440 RepID=UPI0036B82121